MTTEKAQISVRLLHGFLILCLFLLSNHSWFFQIAMALRILDMFDLIRNIYASHSTCCLFKLKEILILIYTTSPRHWYPGILYEGVVVIHQTDQEKPPNKDIPFNIAVGA